MNTVFFVTPTNASELRETASLIAQRQKSLVNGALVVVHTKGCLDAALAIASELSGCFKAVRNMPVPANFNHHTKELATLLGCFLVHGYSLFPGPWLIFDSWAAPLVDDVLTLAGAQHRSTGGQVSGRHVERGGGKMPVGPMVLGMQRALLKFMTFAHASDWRERIMPMVTRNNFQTIPADQWLWSLSRDKAQVPVVIDHEPTPLTLEQVDEMDDSQLHSFILKASGRAAHWKAGREKLLCYARELVSSALQAQDQTAIATPA